MCTPIEAAPGTRPDLPPVPRSRTRSLRRLGRAPGEPESASSCPRRSCPVMTVKDPRGNDEGDVFDALPTLGMVEGQVSRPEALAAGPGDEARSGASPRCGALELEWIRTEEVFRLSVDTESQHAVEGHVGSRVLRNHVAAPRHVVGETRDVHQEDGEFVDSQRCRSGPRLRRRSVPVRWRCWPCCGGASGGVPRGRCLGERRVLVLR